MPSTRFKRKEQALAILISLTSNEHKEHCYFLLEEKSAQQRNSMLSEAKQILAISSFRESDERNPSSR